MCAVVVDVAGLVAQIPASASAPEEMLLPYTASLRHNDCHYVYQVMLVQHHRLAQHVIKRIQQSVHVSDNLVELKM